MLDMSEKSITAYAKAVTKGADVGKFGSNSAKENRTLAACGRKLKFCVSEKRCA